MSVRDEIVSLIRFEASQSPLWHRAMEAGSSVESDDVSEMLKAMNAYCDALHAAAIRLAEEIDRDREA